MIEKYNSEYFQELQEKKIISEQDILVGKELKAFCAHGYIDRTGKILKLRTALSQYQLLTTARMYRFENGNFFPASGEPDRLISMNDESMIMDVLKEMVREINNGANYEEAIKSLIE